MDSVILHVDVNNFYASVAISLNKTLQNKPVVICGDPDKRHGIVLAKSNYAKKKGIKTGDTLGEAFKLCPDLITLPPDYKQYTQISNKLYELYKRYTPYVEGFGLDECWLDVTGSLYLYGSGEDIANHIRKTVKEEFGLSVSIGVSFTKVFAKLGSDMKKPDAITVINKNNFKNLIWKLPVSELLYIGDSIKKKLYGYNIKTIGDLANSDKKFLEKKLGKIGIKLYHYANGSDNEKVGVYYENHIPESISNGTTCSEDIITEHSVTSMVFSLSEVIAFRLRKHKLLAYGIGIYVKNNEFNIFSKQIKLEEPTSDARIIGKEAVTIILKNCKISEKNPLRAVTLSTHDFISEEHLSQYSIFNSDTIRYLEINKKLDNIRKKYGYSVLKKAIEIDDCFVCDAKEIEEGFIPFNKTHQE